MSAWAAEVAPMAVCSQYRRSQDPNDLRKLAVGSASEDRVGHEMASATCAITICITFCSKPRLWGTHTHTRARHLMKTVEDDSEAHGGDDDHGDGGHRWYDADCDVA